MFFFMVWFFESFIVNVEEEREVILIVLWLSVFCVFVSLPQDAVGFSAVCNCVIY